MSLSAIHIMNLHLNKEGWKKDSMLPVSIHQFIAVRLQTYKEGWPSRRPIKAVASGLAMEEVLPPFVSSLLLLPLAG